MKTLLKWAIRKFANNAKLKDAIRKANANLAKKEAGERATKIMGYGNDASETVAVYLEAYANDGKIDEAELAKINAQTDKMVDKYLSDERIDLIVDKLFD